MSWPATVKNEEIKQNSVCSNMQAEVVEECKFLKTHCAIRWVNFLVTWCSKQSTIQDLEFRTFRNYLRVPAKLFGADGLARHIQDWNNELLFSEGRNRYWRELQQEIFLFYDFKAWNLLYRQDFWTEWIFSALRKHSKTVFRTQASKRTDGKGRFFSGTFSTFWLDFMRLSSLKLHKG